ncbi:chromosome partitioning protein ParB [Oceanospirillum multiglobuliferum]|uniref:Probable chromosome-partitioning protein ParB n=1 Tax=Oceanospirillum multiglobuliferum TaxID=64969 RepID=A0A1V4T6G6_9GAMM|nr:chromosome partitioning protein ParB [Oceanospirillum multiglobuliferum]
MVPIALEKASSIPNNADNLSLDNTQDTSAQNAKPKDGEMKYLPVEFLRRGRYQPRRDMDPEALEDLASSIRVQGIMQPIVVRMIEQDQFEIIAGERRWRAAQLAELEQVPVIIREVADDAAIAMALIENIQRENLNPVEEAFALQRLQQEFELTQQQVADAVGKSRSTVTNLLRLLALPDDVRRMLEYGDIEMGHARALLALDSEAQSEAARQVAARGMSVRQTEAFVKKVQQPSAEKAEKSELKYNPDIEHLQKKLGACLGASVEIRHHPKGKGKLIISYTNLDELDGILSHIR